MGSSTTVIERVVEVYALDAGRRSFREDLEAHLLHGWVYSTPSAFAMARLVPRGAGGEELADVWAVWPLWECDAWFVWCACGDLGVIAGWMPHVMPWVGFARGDCVRWWRIERFVRWVRKGC
jgi:hypothetical protein